LPGWKNSLQYLIKGEHAWKIISYNIKEGGLNMRTLLSTLFVLTLLTISTAAFGATGLAVTYEINGQSYEGYFITPSKEAPLILMIHDWDGLTDYEIKRAHMLAEAGYSVFAADLFGKGIRPTDLADKRARTGDLYKNREKMRALMKGALDTAKNKGANITNAVAMGYCFGGAAVLELARSGAELKGFISFHGGLETPAGQNYTGTKGKLLVLHGSADSAVPIDHFVALTKELELARVPHEMITYGGADHAFSVFGGERYQETADKKSWKRFQEFLAETLK
jgi:dienelactone hydrolase